ncbi:MAG: dTDP-4-dehydrorhamnose reductase [Bacteroidales bacterium]|nr:dTDP-4-dehydrorhamnose reductase [Bacteroidales bacterium]MDD3913652.1 dTDP-4-dehydrorhamnose reductase [Bacteroidales bacterium]MDD4633903.1 dTDP-4-dehydrorhamnose reductase [Bacteroidales bacterium]
MNILVFGANGQLGSSFRKIAKNYIYSWTFVDKDDIDFCDKQALSDYLYKTNFDIVVNCAAYTAVDAAENDKDICYKINVEAPAVIAEVVKSKGKVLFHISTDYVFDGETTTPYTETVVPNPINYYGITKLKGEEAIRTCKTSGFIIRVSGLVSEFGSNFVKNIAEKMLTQSEISVVNTQISRFTYAPDLANLIVRLIGKEGYEPVVLNFANKHAMSWAQLAMLVKERLKCSCTIKEVQSYPQEAKRPLYSVLDTSKVERMYNVGIKPIESRINLCLADILGED